MYLKTMSGKIIFEGRFHKVGQAVAAAIDENISLENVNLRSACLKNINLDGANLKGACLWGADLDNADMTGVDLTNSDCRNVNFKDCCLADARMSGVDLSGSYFSRTILAQADLSETRFSCPSIFNVNLHEAKSLQNSIYCHLGEVECDLSRAPIVIHGLSKPIILMGSHMMIGQKLHNLEMNDVIFGSFMQLIATEKNVHYE